MAMMNASVKKTRDPVIDWLRVIGLLLVIGAHCRLPGTFQFLREFDVVLLFFVSGISFAMSGNVSYTGYLKKRFMRLIVPVWCVEVILFAVSYVLGHPFPVRTMIMSFFMTGGGIMFVWVYRVFFTNALLMPLLAKIPLPSGFTGGIVPAGVMVVNALLYRYVIAGIVPEALADIICYLISYTAGWAAVSWFGMLFYRMEEKAQAGWTLLWAAVFIVLGISIGFPLQEAYKFPPQMYYLSYGLAVSGMLVLVLKRFAGSSAGIAWISKHTMEIYLVHILVYYLAAQYLENGLVQYVLMAGVPCLCIYLVEQVKGRKAHG